MAGKEIVMEKIVDFERFKYGHSKKRKEEYNIYIDKETNEVIFDPYVNTVLTKLDLLYDNYIIHFEAVHLENGLKSTLFRLE